MNYFITCIRYNRFEDECYDIRCWGYVHTYEQAEKVVLENITDIHECGYYNYAVIEAVPSSIPVLYTDISSTWFQIDNEKQTYVPIPVPAFSETRVYAFS